MTLLEQTYRQLAAVGLTTTAEEFSKEWVGRHKAWFAYQTHTRRDFSAASAIHCYREIYTTLEYSKSLNQIQRAALSSIAKRISAYLINRYHILSIC